MATETATSIKDKPTKPHNRKQNKQDKLPKRHRSIFEVPSDFFDSCRLLQSLQISLPDNYNSTDGVIEESESEIEINEANNDDGDSIDAKIMQRWSCNTCKVEFESLQDQRFHFKSDLHRLNIKLSISGRDVIREEDFDEAASDSLCKDYDVSSISGSDDEDEKENSVPLIENKQPEIGEISKSKLFMQLQTGERVALWRCLLLDEYENISFENERSLIVDGDGNRLHLTQKEVIEKLKYVTREPRDNTQLRIVLLARGGHFAGCVFDGNSLVAHKTFHRYVVRAKSGKKQSSKDGGGGRVIHSAGASLRRYNELGLKKDIQELLTLWKPHFALASCIFIYASSDNHQLFFDGKKPYFFCQHRAVRNIPLTVRRPTLKEATRIYSLLTQIYSEISGERAPNTKEELLSGAGAGAGASAGSYSNPESCEKNLGENHLDIKVEEGSSLGREMDDLSITVESEKEVVVCTTTPLHEASKSGNLEKVLELLEQGLDPCIKDERGQTPYMLASEKEVRNTFRRFMAANLEKWDWNAAKVPSALTKEMEDSQAAKQAEKDAKRKAKAKELKKQRKAKEKKAQAEAAQSQAEAASSRGNSSLPTQKGHSQPSGSAKISKEEELRRSQAAEREKRAAAAERRMAAAQKTQGTGSLAAVGGDNLCSCCNDSLAGKVPFHRCNYKYCSSTCMHLHKEILEVE